MSDDASEIGDEALHAALRRVLAPLARLAVSQGVSHATLDGWLREALVREAYEAHPEVPAHRRVSRVSAATGLHRREVARLIETREQPQPAARSVTSELFAHWRSDARYRDAQGHPRHLPRTGAMPSFESLAHEVTRDVHPRTLLEELLRLKLATLNPATDVVTLVADSFVPRHDAKRMVAFLGDNVGDHLDAAVTNVVQGGGRHFEQAVFADGLTDASVAEFKKLVEQHWTTLTESIVPALESMIERDNQADPRAPRRRIRLGLYGFDDAQTTKNRAPKAAGDKELT